MDAKGFAEKEIAPHVARLEEDIPFRLELFRKMAKANLFLLAVSKESGGAFSDTLSYLLALKEIAKVDAGISVAMAVTNMVAECIATHGSEKQKKQFIPKISSGENIPLSFALTEKNAGSDAKNIASTAHRQGDCFKINGEKQFITNGDLAKILLVFAKTEKGISAFLVDHNASGLSVTKKERKLGLLTANLVSLKFEDTSGELLGHEGEGFKLALSALDSGRLSIAAQAIGIAEAAYEAALNFAKNREQFGHAISENQAIAFKLADMHVKLSASRLLLEKAALLKDEGKPFSLEASEAKLYCSEACNEITAEALQIHGGYGYIKDYPVEKYFRDARVTTLYEGTSEIQRIVISRSILK